MLAKQNVQTANKQVQQATTQTRVLTEKVIKYETHIKTLEKINDAKTAKAVTETRRAVPDNLHDLCTYTTLHIRDGDADWRESSTDVGDRPTETN